MPWTTPPWIWPSTSIGLMMVPKSLTAVYFTTSMLPVSGSTSTSQTWQPFGIGRRRAVADVLDVERLRPVGRQLHAAGADLVGQLHDADRAVGAGDDELAVLELDVAGRGFERVRGDLLALLDHLGGGFDDRLAGIHHRARAAGAAAGDQLVAVALEEADLLERHAELLAQHLGERRGVALAVVERAGADGDAAVGVEADAAHLLVGGRGDFEIAADADAAHAAALLALALALVEALPVGASSACSQDAGKSPLS